MGASASRPLPPPPPPPTVTVVSSPAAGATGNTAMRPSASASAAGATLTPDTAAAGAAAAGGPSPPSDRRRSSLSLSSSLSWHSPQIAKPAAGDSDPAARQPTGKLFTVSFTFHLYTIYTTVRAMCMNKWIVVFQPFPDGSPVGPGGGWKRDANGSLPVTAIADTATSFVSAHRFSGPFESVLLGAALLCAIGATSVYFMRFFEHLLPTKVWSLAGMGFGCLQAIFTVAAIAHFHHDDGTPNTDMGQGLLAAAFSAGIEIFSILLMARDGMKNNFRNDQLRPAEQKYVLANAFIISVLILGGIGFRYLADMDFEDSFPFAIETALSLGYGNPTMPNPGSRIFLMAYFVLAACGFAFFFYGQHEMILERHEMKTKRKIEERRRRRQYVLDRVKAHHDKHHPGEEYELPTGFLDDRELARPGGIIVMLLRRFGLYFHLIKPTPFEQALMEARAARIAKKKRKRQKKFEEMKKRRHCDAQPTSGKELESNGRPDVVKFDDGHDGDEARGTDGEGDVTDSSDAVVEVLSGVIPGELLLDRNNLVGRVSGSGDTVDGGRYSHESRTAPVVGLSPQGEEVAVDKAGRRPRSPTREATDGSSLTLGETEGIMEEELDKIIENQRVRQFFLLVLGLWFGSAGVFQWTEPTWTYFDAIYFCFCTMATIGYGDVYPTTSYCWELWYLFVMTAVGVYALLFNIIGEISARKYDAAISYHRKRRKKPEQLNDEVKPSDAPIQ